MPHAVMEWSLNGGRVTMMTMFDGTSRAPGDFGWDPMDMYPTDPAGRVEMQTKELNNGRVAMIAMAGMVAQELATGAKLF